MFSGSYFSKAFFAGSYYAPNGEVVTPLTVDAPIVGFTANTGMLMARR